MSHFDHGVLTSFRNNQDRYQQVSKLPHGMGNMSAPVRRGKTVEDLIAPPRKGKIGSQKYIFWLKYSCTLVNTLNFETVSSKT
jgi:hypothetical protein